MVEAYQPIHGFDRGAFARRFDHRIIRRHTPMLFGNVASVEQTCACGGYIDAYPFGGGPCATQAEVEALLDRAEEKFHNHLLRNLVGIEVDGGVVRRAR